MKVVSHNSGGYDESDNIDQIHTLRNRIIIGFAEIHRGAQHSRGADRQREVIGIPEMTLQHTVPGNKSIFRRSHEDEEHKRKDKEHNMPAHLFLGKAAHNAHTPCEAD